MSNEIVPDSTTHESIRRNAMMDDSPARSILPSSPSPVTISTTTTKPRSTSQQQQTQRRTSNVVTYGRRKLAEEPLPTPDASIVIDTSTTSTRFDAQVTPPDSDKEDEESDNEGASNSFMFSFRKDLEDIDRQYDEEEVPSRGEPAAVTQEHAPLQKSSSLSSLPTETDPFSPPRATSKTTPSKPRRSVTTLESASEAEDDEGENNKSPSPVKSRIFHRSLKRRAVVDSESEDEAPPSRKSSPAKRQTTPSPSTSTRPALENLFNDDSPLKRKSSPPASAGNDEDEEHLSDVSSSSRPKSTKGRKSQKDKTKAGKIRPPTKKELRETKKEQSILLAGQYIQVPREEGNRLAITNIFSKIANPFHPLPRTTAKGRNSLSSDPISDSSPSRSGPSHGPLRREDSSTLSEIVNSSPLRPSITLTPGLTKSTSTVRSTPALRTPFSDHEIPPAKPLSLFGFGDEDHDEMPSFADLRKSAKVDIAKVELENKKKAAEVKKLALAKQQAAAAAKRKQMEHDEDEDDELEIENGVEIEESQESLMIVEEVPGRIKTTQALSRRVFGDHLASAQKQRRTASLVKPPPGFGRRKSEATDATESQIVYAARHNRFGLTDSKELLKSRRSVGGGTKPVKDMELSHMLLGRTAAMASAVRKEKEEEWVGKGGKLKNRVQEEASGEDRTEWLKKAIENAEKGKSAQMDDEDEDAEDGDYAPGGDEDAENEEEYRGSASPSPPSRRPATTQSEDEATEDDTIEDKENLPPPLRNRSRTDSGSSKENEIVADKENVPPPLVRGRIVPGSSGLADEDDLFSPRKQLDQEEEDKENAPPPARQLDFGGDENDEDEDAVLAPVGGRSRRRALGRVILDEEDEEGENTSNPFGSPIVNDENARPPTQSSRKLQSLKFDMDSDQEESGAGRRGGAGGLFGGGKPLGKALFHSSQESLSLGDGLDFFGDGEGEGDGMTQLFKMENTKRKSFDHLREDPLGTMDLESQKLLPAMIITTQERQRDEAIFQEDQEARAQLDREDLLKERRASKPLQYISEDGFLTQTKPFSQAVALPESPELSMGKGRDMLLTPATMIGSGIGTQMDLEDDDEDDSMEERPLKRLIRGARPAEPSPARPLNAFEVMMTGGVGKKHKQSKEKTKKIGKSVFVAGEAEESDEEAVFGFGGAGLKEDDEDEEGDDKHLEGLVDDQHLTQDVLNEDAVLEKVLEHAAQDDAELEKLHQAAADGKLRGKKRDRGIGIEGDSDSDDEEADEKNRRRRQSMKKRKVNAESLDALASNSKTAAFYNQYQQGIAADEENEFGHVPTSDVEGETERRDGQGSDDDGMDDGMDDDGDDEDSQSKPKKVISIFEAEKLAVEAMANGAIPFDPDNLNWMDPVDDDMDDDMDVKEVTLSKLASDRVFGQQEVDQEMKREQFRFDRIRGVKLTSAMRKQDDKSTSTAKANAAVTGHKSKAKSSSSSVTASQASSTSSKVSGKSKRKPLKKAPTILGGISRKKSGFES